MHEWTMSDEGWNDEARVVLIDACERSADADLAVRLYFTHVFLPISGTLRVVDQLNIRVVDASGDAVEIEADALAELIKVEIFERDPVGTG